MKTRNFTFISISLIITAHLALIPLLSFFGLNICSLLKESGFWFGCQESSKLIFKIILSQIVFLSLSYWTLSRDISFKNKHYRRKLIGLLPEINLVFHTTTFYLFSLPYQNNIGEVSPHSKEVILFLSIAFSLVAVTTWKWLQVQTMILESRLNLVTINEFSEKKPFSLVKLWFDEQKFHLIPLLGVFIFFTCYTLLFLESLENNEDLFQILKSGKTHFLYIAMGLISWHLMMYFFEFYRNYLLSSEISLHLEQISKQEFSLKRSISPTGFYKLIFSLVNNLANTLLKKSRLLKGFSAFVSESVAQEILNPDIKTTNGAKKDVAILMADIRDFTHLSSHLKPEEIVDLLNTYFTDMLEIFTEHGVVLDKFIGDGILAYLPLEKENQTIELEKITKVAFQMHHKINQTNLKLKEKNLPKLKVGISLHKGKVVVGSIGGLNRKQHTIIGDPVNMASRLETLCKDFQVGVIASSVVVDSLSSQYKLKFVSLGTQKIRGFDNPIEIYGALPIERKLVSVA